MRKPSAIRRRSLLAGSAGLMFAPAIIGRAAAATRGVSDTEIVIGMMTDLSGVTAVQGSNAAKAIRLAFDAANAQGGIAGRKIRFIVEDDEYLVPKAVQAMNKLLNRDNIFISVGGGGTPHMDAVLPSLIEKQVPNVFPLTCARSMFEPLSPYKFGQFASYYDQMRAAVKYFVAERGKKTIGIMYQDTDFGKDNLAGAQAQIQAMGLKVAAVTGHRPTDTDFNAPLTVMRDAKCDAIMMGTIVKDTTIIAQTARKMGWDVDLVGQFASYSTAVAEAPGGAAEGFYSMSPALYRYGDDPHPQVQAFFKAFRDANGIDPNYLGEAGYTQALFVLDVLRKVGRDLTTENFIAGMEGMKDWHDIFGGPPLSLSATDHHASSQSFLSVVKNARWVPVVDGPLSF
jgi:branched-chain amino acid transport system substrate-binding protein